VRVLKYGELTWRGLEDCFVLSGEKRPERFSFQNFCESWKFLKIEVRVHKVYQNKDIITDQDVIKASP